MRVQSLGREDPLEKEMTAHSSIPAWKTPMDRGAWWATVHGVSKELDVTKRTCRLWGDVVQPITPFPS